VIERLPKPLRASVRRVLRQAWELDDADKAERLLRNLARRLDQEAPGVAASILEGLDEMLTVNRLGLPVTLRRSLACTNSIENMMGTVRRVCRNVKRWRNAAMALRWTAAGMMEAAFFDFIHRDKIEQASYAHTLLRIIADPLFCETLVKRAPWRVATTLREISAKHLFAHGAEQFVRQLAHQAILRDDGMMAREVGYHGFGTAPLLSESLFSDLFMLERYNPLGSFYVRGDVITTTMLKRFNSAAERCYLTLIEEHHTQRAQVVFSIASFYRSVFMRAWKIQKQDDYDYQLTSEMWNAVGTALKLANKLLASVSQRSYDALFVTNLKQRRDDVLETLVEIAYEALAEIANRFKGYDDAFWHMAINLFLRAFPSIGQQPDGMTPFQQRLALKIVHTLEDNMKGFYPAICRVVLSCVGPYQHQAPQPNRTAFNIFKDAVYSELQRLPQLAISKPDKFADYLPDDVMYDTASSRLTHTYQDGR
jgi:hypothetical protein